MKGTITITAEPPDTNPTQKLEVTLYGGNTPWSGKIWINGTLYDICKMQQGNFVIEKPSMRKR